MIRCPHPLAFVFTLLGFAAFAPLPAAEPAAPDFTWVAPGGGPKSDKTRALSLDGRGNVYLTGEVMDEGKFGEIEVKGSGNYDCAIAKVDAQGHYLWVRLLGGSQIDRGYGIAPDAEGNVYVTGHYQSTDLMVNGEALPNAGDYDVFLAKYDRDGKLLWIKTAGGKGYDYGHGLAIDAQGNIYITGAVVGEASFSGTAVPNDPGAHLFCAKYAPDGRLIWVKASTGKAWSAGLSIGLDRDGNPAIAGTSSGIGALGGHPLTHPTPGRDAILVKFTSEGEVAWIAQEANGENVTMDAVTVDGEGRIWTAGMFKGKATLGAESLATAGEKNSFAFVQHYSPEGKLIWSRVGQGPAIAYGLGIATDGCGRAFVTGEFSESMAVLGATLQTRGTTDIYVAAFKESGELDWIVQAGGKAGDNAYALAWQPTGDLVIGGAFAGPADFGSRNVAATRGADLYVAKLHLPPASGTK